MIVFENGTWQTDSDYPDTNYLEGLDTEQPKYVVPDGSELAAKIQSMSSGFTSVEDENGELIDVKPVEPTQEEQNAVRADEVKVKLADLAAQADELRAELAELMELEEPEEPKECD